MQPMMSSGFVQVWFGVGGEIKNADVMSDGQLRK